MIAIFRSSPSPRYSPICALSSLGSVIRKWAISTAVSFRMNFPSSRDLMPRFGLKLNCLMALLKAVFLCFSFSNCSGSSSKIGVDGAIGVWASPLVILEELSFPDGSRDSRKSSDALPSTVSGPPVASAMPCCDQFTRDLRVSTKQSKACRLMIYSFGISLSPFSYGVTICAVVNGGGRVPLDCQSAAEPFCLAARSSYCC